MIEDIFIAYPYFLSVVCSVLLVDKYRAKLHQQNNDNRGHFICFFSTWMEKLFYVNWMMSSPHLPHTFLCLFYYFFAPLKLLFFAYFIIHTNMHMCIYACIHMYIQSIYRWICAYMCTYTRMYMQMYMSVHIYTCGYVGVCLCAYLLRTTVQYNSESHTQF